MKKQLFIKKVKRKVTLVSKSDLFESECGQHIVQLERVKGFFEYINFDCQIKKDGTCKEYKTKGCCCTDCLDRCGYFLMMLNEETGYYARHFSVKTGFWRKGKGCILPHKKRSIVCLTHHCNHDYCNSPVPKGEPFFVSGISLLKQEMCHNRERCLDAASKYK